MKHGAQVRVLTRRYPGLPATDVVDGIEVFRLPVAGRGRNRLSSVLFVIGVLVWLVRHRGEHDVVHAHQAFAPATAALLAKRVTGRPVVVKITGSGPGGNVDLLRRGRFRQLRLRMIRAVDRFLIVDQQSRRELVEYGIASDRISEVRNGVDTDYFTPATVAHEPSRQTLQVLFVGRLDPVKALDTLLVAWKEIGAARMTSPARLVIVGDGAERESLIELATRLGIVHEIEFTGFSNEVLPLYHSADVLVLPSLAEGMPNSLLEGMACGLPVVASGVGGIPELITDGKHGLIVSPGDAHDFAMALARLLRDPELRMSMGRSARDEVAASYSLDAAVSRHLDLYRQVSQPDGAYA